jgi:hypothetical protein
MDNFESLTQCVVLALKRPAASQQRVVDSFDEQDFLKWVEVLLVHKAVPFFCVIVDILHIEGVEHLLELGAHTSC